MGYLRSFSLGVSFGLIYWFGEATIHVLVFHSGSWLSNLLPLDTNEIWMRLFIVLTFIIFSLGYEFLVQQQLKVTQHMVLAYRALNIMQEACVITNSKNEIVYVNPRYEEISGYTLADVQGKNPSILSSGEQDGAFYKKMWSTLQTKGYWEGELWNRSKEGRLYPQWIGISVVRDSLGEPEHYIGVFNDITSQKEAEDKIKYYAYHDPLTNLPNRRYFVEQVQHAIKVAKRAQQKIGLMFLDLDHFKQINDQHGHLVGDEFLRRVADMIKPLIREVDVLSRFGGDEFVVVLPNIRSEKELLSLGKRLISGLDKTKITIGSLDFKVQVSIGAAIYPDDSLSAEELIHCADVAMYQVKKTTRHSIGLFSLLDKNK
jgi:diguanylate cyclase (GGDEF)-like protein/PAS domain S-box-containing protein